VRVLLTTRGSSGHLGPLAPFGHACVRAGHEVVVAAQRQHEANVKRTGLAFAPVDDPPDEEWMPLMGSFAELDMATANALMISEFFAGIDLRAELPGLRAIVESRRPDIIVRESWEFGSTLVAELYGIPIVCVGLGLAAIEDMTIELAAPKLDEARAALGLPPDPAGERLRNAPYFTAIPAALEDPAVTPPPRTHRFRFGTAERTAPLPEWWPGGHDPLVYLTFGSVASAPHLPFFPDLYREAIEALESLPVRVLVTTGNDAGGAEELGRLSPNVHVERWVPHDDVASQAAVIVCHGGYGSTLGALAHGVPLVVLPLFSSDQWANGDAVARAGAGVSLDGERDTRAVLGLPSAETLGGLGRAVENVLDDPVYRREAQRLAHAMRALPAVEESIEALAAIAEE
jgi:UDP:flavonoid glycosyltransferase YjiC (YdhE family)